MDIRPFDRSHLEDVIHLSLRAWAPVFASLRKEMDPEVFAHFYPEWRIVQAQAVEAACTGEGMHARVALEEDRAIGFMALKLHEEDRMGEIHMIAVDPEHQRRGIAGEMTRHALDWFAKSGMSVVMVETGGDPGHAPARRAYESCGFEAMSVARYFKKI